MDSTYEFVDGKLEDCTDEDDVKEEQIFRGNREDSEDENEDESDEEDEDIPSEENQLQYLISGCTDEEYIQWNAIVETMGLNLDADLIREEHFKNILFVSIEQAESFYMLYAKMRGFSVRRKVKRKNKHGTCTTRSWVCSSEGSREEKYCNLEDRIHEVRPITRTGCIASFRIRLNKKIGNWYVKHFNHHHNHRLAVFCEKAFLRSNRNVSDSAKEHAMSMKRAGIKTSSIYNYQAAISKGWENVGFLKSDLYRGIRKIYAKWNDSDTETAISILGSKKGPDPKFFYKFEADDESRLTNLFWSESSCQLDYKLFGDCLAFDSTYKTNRYGKPLVLLLGSNNHDKTCVFGAALLQDESAETYVWLLQTFLECMDQKMPKTILTDGCKSMSKGLQTVMPGIPHRICSWHILKNAMTNIKKEDFNTDLKKLINRYYEEEEWEQNWREMVQKHNVADHPWVLAQYGTRMQWADTFLRSHYFGGAKATGRCESMNALLKNGLENNIPLWLFFRQYDFCLSQLHFAEMKEHFKTNLTETMSGQTSMQSLEAQVSSMFTREVYLKIKRQMHQAVKYNVDIDNQSDPEHTICEVRVYGHTGVRRIVKVSKDHQNVDFVECSCNYLVAKAYPCRHIFVSLKNLDITTLPLCLVNRRWLKEAKPVEHLSNNKDNHSSHPEAAKHSRYGAVSKQIGITSYLACRSKEAFDIAMKAVFDLNLELEKIPPADENEKEQCDGRSCPTPIRDAHRSVTKGRPSTTVKRRTNHGAKTKAASNGKNKRIRRHPNHCRTCGETGHDSRNCPQKKKQDTHQEA